MFIHESGTNTNPTIIFLHGDGANGAMWEKLMEQLSDYHCLAPDFPGFGRSNDLEWISINDTTDRVIDVI